MPELCAIDRALLVLAGLALGLAACGEAPRAPASAAQPNIVWIVADDMSFELGAYGDPVARTPNLDRLAGEGVRYTNAFSTSGVCAPSRATLVTGMYATSIGAHHMRSIRGRAPGQPFFAHVDIFDTHESRLFGTRPTSTDPATVTVPPYYPDTAAVRGDFARHYDNVASLDAKVGDVLAMLDQDGVADDTVVFFFADNGRGLPRDKRWVYDGGAHVPLIVRWPEHLTPGTTSDELPPPGMGSSATSASRSLSWEQARERESSSTRRAGRRPS